MDQLRLLFSLHEIHSEKINLWYHIEKCLRKISPLLRYVFIMVNLGVSPLNSFGTLIPNWGIVPSKDY